MQENPSPLTVFMMLAAKGEPGPKRLRRSRRTALASEQGKSTYISTFSDLLAKEHDDPEASSSARAGAPDGHGARPVRSHNIIDPARSLGPLRRHAKAVNKLVYRDGTNDTPWSLDMSELIDFVNETKPQLPPPRRQLGNIAQTSLRLSLTLLIFLCFLLHLIPFQHGHVGVNALFDPGAPLSSGSVNTQSGSSSQLASPPSTSGMPLSASLPDPAFASANAGNSSDTLSAQAITSTSIMTQPQSTASRAGPIVTDWFEARGDGQFNNARDRCGQNSGGYIPATGISTEAVAAAKSTHLLNQVAKSILAPNFQSSLPGLHSVEADAAGGSAMQAHDDTNRASLSRPLPHGCHRIAQDDFLQQVCAHHASQLSNARVDYAQSSAKDISIRPGLGVGMQGGADAGGGRPGRKELIICPVDDDVAPLVNANGKVVGRDGKGEAQAYAISGTMVLETNEKGSQSASMAAEGDDGYWRQVNGEQVWIPNPPASEDMVENQPSTSEDPEPLMLNDSRPTQTEGSAVPGNGTSSRPVAPAEAPPDAGHATASVTEPVVDAAKEYDAWKASIGGQNAPAFLSFAEWKERHFAEKEKEEQERRERRKKEKLKEREEKKKSAAAAPTAQPNSAEATEGLLSVSRNDNSASATYAGLPEGGPANISGVTSSSTESPAPRELSNLPIAQVIVTESQTSAALSASSTIKDNTTQPTPAQTSIQSANTVTIERSVASTKIPVVAVESPSTHGDGMESNASNKSQALQRIEMQMVAPGGAMVKGHVQKLPADEGGAAPAVANPATRLATLKHRWNFASLDCAAVIHRANPSARFASSILSEKKDRYMLSPCPGASDGDPQGQFVVVELCDEIKIDTLVLANFEFFSRMFKRFRVRVSKNLLDDPEDWFDLGTYRARNLRGLQVFNVPPLTGDRQFFRYMRIDILEHYGSEYYCPLSLLRVYGLTQLDDFKKEEEESQRLLEAMANDDAEFDLDDELDNEAQEGDQQKMYHEAHRPEQLPNVHEAKGDASTPSGDPASHPPASSPQSEEQAYMMKALNEMIERSLHGIINDASRVEALGIEEDAPPSDLSAEAKNVTTSKEPAANTRTPSDAGLHLDRGTNGTQPSPAGASAGATEKATPGTATPVSDTPDNAARAVPAQAAAAAAVASNRSGTSNNGHSSGSGSGSESIYRAITKRLNALEANATLSLQYMEHNGQMLLDVFARMEKKQDDRLSEMLRSLNASNWRQIEALKRRQHVDLQRAIFEFDVHRQQAESERVQLLSQVHVLAGEVLLERRLSLAQLTLLLGLFGFVALTRGNTSPFRHLRSFSPLSIPPSPRQEPVGNIPPQINVRDAHLHSSANSSAVGTPKSAHAARRRVAFYPQPGTPQRAVRTHGHQQANSRSRPLSALMTPQRTGISKVIEVSSPKDSPTGSRLQQALPLQAISTNALSTITAAMPTTEVSSPNSKMPLREETLPERDVHRTPESPYRSRFARIPAAAGAGDESVSSEWSERSDSSNAGDSDAENIHAERANTIPGAHSKALAQSVRAPTLLASAPLPSLGSARLSNGESPEGSPSMAAPTSIHTTHHGFPSHLSALTAIQGTSQDADADADESDSSKDAHNYHQQGWQTVSSSRRQTSLRSRTASMKKRLGVGIGARTPERLKTPDRGSSGVFPFGGGGGGGAGTEDRPVSPLARTGTPDTVRGMRIASSAADPFEPPASAQVVAAAVSVSSSTTQRKGHR